MNADKFTCLVSEAKQTVLECSVPNVTWQENMVAFGTVGAAVIALAFGVISGIDSLKSRRRARRSRHNSRLENAGSRVIEGFETLLDIDSEGWHGAQAEIKKRVSPFVELLDKNSDSHLRFGSRLDLFTLQVLTYLHPRKHDNPETALVAGVMRSMASDSAVGCVRRGINAITDAENESERRAAWNDFDSATARIQRDLERLDKKD